MFQVSAAGTGALAKCMLGLAEPLGALKGPLILEETMQYRIAVEDMEPDHWAAWIVAHIAAAENWYFEKLDLGLDSTRLSAGPLEKLARVRRNTHEQVWKLIGETRITENDDEKWSARKGIRRILWHERDHTQQIEKLSSWRQMVSAP